tara:strand:+ start:1453 stop:2337 length:885 start_codon:yes stop_codon:yes gene_type:complete
MIIKESNIYSKEEEMSVIKITGKDAISFLQGQFSNDIKELDGSNYQISSYSTNQGKVLGIFRILKRSDEYLILINSKIANKLLDKLNMYKLGSDVMIILENNICLYSIISEIKIDEINKNEKYQIKKKDNYVILNNCHDQILSYIYITTKKDLYDEYLMKNYKKVDYSILRLLDMLKGIHHLNEYSFEKFIPQNLNMSSDMGINFKKGCYIGQEIIARTHYLGKVKKNIAIIETNGIYKNSEKINNQDNEVVGEIIDDIFSTNNEINLYMIMIREVNKSDKIYINKEQVKLIKI